jgi:hypothetical protein
MHKENIMPKTTDEALAISSGETIAVKIKRGGEYGVWGIEILRSTIVPKGMTAKEVIDESTSILTEKIYKFIKDNGFDIELETEGGTDFITEEPKESESTTEESSGSPITPEEIMEMDRAELEKLIEDNELGIDVKKFKKTIDLAKEIVKIISDPVENEDPGSDEPIPVNAEMIREMERDELEKLISEKELNINPKKFKKTNILAEMVVSELFPDEDDSQESEKSAGEEHDPTEEEVRSMDRDQLTEIIKNYNLDIDPTKIKKDLILVETVISELFVDDTEETETGSDKSPFDSAEGFGDE